MAFRDCLSNRTASAVIVSPLGLMCPFGVLLLVSIWTPWWVAQRIAPSDPDDPYSTVLRQTSQISLWDHIGCKSNESWAEICALPDKQCIAPPAPPPTYLAPWTPPPKVEEQTYTIPPAQKASDVTAVYGRPTTTPPATTTLDPYWGEPVTEQNTVQNLGDQSAREVDEGAVTPSDVWVQPPTAAPDVRPTAGPTLKPIEVGGRPPFTSSLPPTTFRARGAAAGIWQGTGSGSQEISYDPLSTEVTPGAAPPPTGPPPVPPHPGIVLSMSDCPPEGEPAVFADENGPPASEWICTLKQKCGTLDPVIIMLFGAGCFMVGNVFILLCFGCMSGADPETLSRSHPIEFFLDFLLPYISFVLCLMQTICVAIAVRLANGSGMAELKWHNSPVIKEAGVGSICAGLCLALGILSCIISCTGLLMRKMMVSIAEEAKALAKEKAAYEQAALEATEEWRLQQDAEKARKKPAPLGWRSVRVFPENDQYALEDGQSSQWTPSEVSEGNYEVPALAIGSSVDQQEVSRYSVVTLKPQHQSAAAADALALKRSSYLESPALRSIKEEAPSKAVEKCIRSFISSGEGAVYAQHFPQLSQSPPATPSSALSSARGQEEWVPKVSRSTGQTYWVNPETGETRWDAPDAPEEILREARVPEAAEAPAEQPPGKELWKKKRLKNGVVVSVKVLEPG